MLNMSVRFFGPQTLAGFTLFTEPHPFLICRQYQNISLCFGIVVEFALSRSYFLESSSTHGRFGSGFLRNAIGP